MRTHSVSRVIAAAVVTLVVAAGCTGAESAAGADNGSGTTPTPSRPPTTAPTTTASDGGHAGGSVGQGSGDPGPALQQDFRRVVNQVLPSVVEIRTKVGLGSGVVYDDRGDVVTNAHVVGDATHFSVHLANRASPVRATLVGKYAEDDLAVIRLANAGSLTLHPASFGDSSSLHVGDIVVAMGSPLGLAGTVTNGIVSAVGREVTEPQDKHSPGAVLPNTIQTSAAINPGNSGGALVDLSGQVMGIPTLAAVNPELRSSAPGIGFAIASNTVTTIADQLVKYGEVRRSHRAALGVTVRTVVNDRGRPGGAGIVDVTAGGPADDAGLKAGAVIVKVNGKRVHSASELVYLLAELKPGKNTSVKVRTPNGKSRTVHVKLGQLSSHD